ncbi:MAG: MarR family transcriptional regulator [Desulfobacterales bacterium]|nr:MarR family transcriptional regulator [Desulfobacterales bacterium]
MTETRERASTVSETSLVSGRPIETLLDMAGDCIATGELKKLPEIDLVINGRFVELIRNGDRGELESVLQALQALLNGEKNHALKRDAAYEKYYYRWENLFDLCGRALENYDMVFTARLLKARKHGARMMCILKENPDGVRAKKLSEKLGISPPHLAKLLKEFEETGLIARQKTRGATSVLLGLLGAAYMAEAKPAMSGGAE